MASNYKKYDLPAAQPYSSLNRGLFSSETAVPSSIASTALCSHQ
jgi:hypothetical protein